MFFAKAGKYGACRIFSAGHLGLVIVTIACIVLALKKTMHKNKNEVLKIIRVLTIILWILEILKMCFNIRYYKLSEVKEWLPLYYCSVLLYATFLSSFTKGGFKRSGDVFIATGSIIGGVCYIILPTTSLPTYPAFHFISLHSFFFHGTMIYLNLLVNYTKYIKLEKKDILNYAAIVGIVCLVALFVNIKFDSNLMFISKDFPNTPIQIIYNYTGKLFTPLMILGQMSVPFYVVYYFLNRVTKKAKCKSISEGE